jgi:excisionase family DNA binding protein
MSTQPHPTDQVLAYSVDEAIQMMRPPVSRSTFYSWINSGAVATVKIGGRRFIPRRALEALFETGEQ